MITDKSMVDVIYEKEDYIYFMEKIYSDERSLVEVNFLTQLLSIQPKHKILDLACGYGRHAIHFASQGCLVTGIDSNVAFINEAKKRAEKKGVAVEYQIGDMRTIDYKNEFDFIFNLGTSFGIFSNEENKKVLKNISKALKPGGKLCLELFSPQYGELIKKGIKKTSIFDFDGNLLLDRAFFHEQTNQIEYKRIYLKEGLRKDAVLFYQLYSLEQLKIILESLSLKMIDIYASPKGNPFNKDSVIMMLVVQKEM